MSNAHRLTLALKRLQRDAIGMPQLPVRGRVVKQYREQNHYCIDVEVLNVHDEPAASWPGLVGIEVAPLFWAGNDTGLWLQIDPGAIVRVGFYDGDRHRPYLDAVLGGGKSPEATGSTFWIKAVGASIQVTPGGVAISAGTVTVGAGYVKIASAKNGGGGGNIDILADADMQIAASGNGVLQASGTQIVDGAVLKLGENAAEPVILGQTFLTLLTTLVNQIKVGGAPIDNVAALVASFIAQVQAQALSGKAKVE